jgi:iron-sulfur cluster repair protein YtfE (RIC family)
MMSSREGDMGMGLRRAGMNLGLMGAAALGLMAGLALGRGKKTVAQAATALHGDWLGVLKAEHRAVQKLLKAMTDTDFGDAARRALLLEKIGDALTRHAVKEENVLYPAFREADPDRAAVLYVEHAEMKTLLRELKELAPEDPLWERKARAFRKLIEAHIREEEKALFPAFHEALDATANEKLTKQMNREGSKLL